MDRGHDELERLRDRIDELEADKRQLLADLDEEKQKCEELLRNLELLLKAYKELSQDRTAPGRGTDEEHVYYGSSNQSKFHRPNCEWAQFIPSWKRVEFSSHAEAVQAGYRPCQTCRA